MLVQILQPDFSLKNERGYIVQLVHAGWNQVNFITSVKGSVRGGHYHKENDEAFYIIQGNVNLLLETSDSTEEYNFRTGDMFMIPCMVRHTFTYCEDTSLISMYSKGVELQDGVKDFCTEFGG